MKQRDDGPNCMDEIFEGDLRFLCQSRALVAANLFAGISNAVCEDRAYANVSLCWVRR